MGDRESRSGDVSGDVYEIRVGGAVGPLSRAALPGFVFEMEPRFTVLTGMHNTFQDLERMLDALRGNGFAFEELRVTPTGQVSAEPLLASPDAGALSR